MTASGALLAKTVPSDKSFYDKEARYSDDTLREFVAAQARYADRYRDSLLRYFRDRPLNILELGAGTCGLSLTLCRSLNVQRGVMFDISAIRMQQYAPRVAKLLNLTMPEFKFVEGDFSDPSHIPEEKFDLILFDASLHHAGSIRDVLQACRNRLSPGGVLVAQREQYLAPLSFPYILERLLRSQEVTSGVSENAYLLDQYIYYLRACGFDVANIRAPETATQRALFFLNGILFSKWVLVARKSTDRIGRRPNLGVLLSPIIPR